MSNAIVPFEEVAQIGKAMVDSGYFADSKNAAQAIVKVMAGRELGLGAFASMTGIHIIQGKPALGANLLASLIKNDRRYDYRVIELTDTRCEIQFTENGEECGRSVFTEDDAKRVGTKNMNKFPKNMLFARAISNGAKWYTPGIFGGAPVYTPEELGADIDVDGNVIDVTPAPTRTEATAMQEIGFDNGGTVTKVERPYPAIIMPERFTVMVAKFEKDDMPATDQMRNMIAANLELCFAGTGEKTDKRKSVMRYLCGKTSTKDLTPAEVFAFTKWLNAAPDENNEWSSDAMAVTEANNCLTEALKAEGQAELGI